jgi:hypothetical protein
MIAEDALGKGDFMGFNSFFHSLVSLFSVYPYTGKTKDVEMVVTDVKVSVKITDIKRIYTITVQSLHKNINYITKTITIGICVITSNKH